MDTNHCSQRENPGIQSAPPPPHLQRARTHGRNRAAGARDHHTVELGQVLNAHDAFVSVEELELVVGVVVVRVVGLHEALGKAHLGAQ